MYAPYISSLHNTAYKNQKSPLIEAYTSIGGFFLYAYVILIY